MDEKILPRLSRLVKVPLRKVWTDEARLFTPWLELEENLELLAESLGLPPLQQKFREHSIGRFAADLICQIGDTADHLLIENQVEMSDHRHLGQLLTYIAGLAAEGLRVRYVAWLAEDFRDEHRQAIEWLNQHLDNHVGFFACRIEVWQIGQSEERAPRFDVLVEPSQIAPISTRSSRRAQPEGPEVDRVAYWSSFSEELRFRNLPVKIRAEPPRIGYYSFTLNAKLGIYIYVYRDVASRSVGAYVSSVGIAPLARLIFERWIAEKAVIEREYGGSLEWREIEIDKNYRVQVPAASGDPANQADWPRQHAWLVDQLEQLHRIFQPRVQALPSRAELLKTIGISLSDP
jgi:Domain of unknown function (DUF4268)